MEKKTAIVDYGMGNLRSVYNALQSLGYEATVVTEPKSLSAFERIILPGVGAFRDCIARLASTGFQEALNEEVLKNKKPVFGICLGLQVMAKRGFEGGEFAGLGWIEADVVRLDPSEANLKVPHIGWNSISYRANSPLFTGIAGRPDVYFVHSYRLDCKDAEDIDAVCEYGEVVPAAIRKGNIYGTQFHPEKSQEIGLRILENFMKVKAK